MKIYVASKYEQWRLARRSIQFLAVVGHTITHDWTAFVQQEMDTSLPEAEREALKDRMAIMDAEGVRHCDVLILYDHDEGKGLYVEMGIAIGLNKPIIVIDKKSNCVFHRLPGVTHVANFDAALVVLAELARQDQVCPAPYHG